MLHAGSSTLDNVLNLVPAAGDSLAVMRWSRRSSLSSHVFELGPVAVLL